jgi:hypothetical protein
MVEALRLQRQHNVHTLGDVASREQQSVSLLLRTPTQDYCAFNDNNDQLYVSLHFCGMPLTDVAWR